MKLEELKQQKVCIVGLGLNNQSLAGFFRAKNVAFELIEQWMSPDELVGRLDAFDIVFRSPGLPYLSRAVQQAKNNGVKIYSQTKLFFDLCPAPIIGVTGTKGKGTTATLIARILERAGKKVWLAGNIGLDPFKFLDEIKSDDWVVLELSSFQLQDLHRSPRIAVVLAITADHLDYHKTLEEYIDAKANIVRLQGAGDSAILNYDSPVTRGFAHMTGAKVYWVSLEQTVAPGCFVGADEIYCDGEKVLNTAQVVLPGRFNLQNVAAAVAAARAAGVTDVGCIRGAVQDFKGLAHRLEFLGDFDEVAFYDDSASTNPDTTTAALGAFQKPIVLIVGGSEKNADYTSLAKAIVVYKVKSLVPIGVTGPKIAKMARAAGFIGRVAQDNCVSMAEIVTAAKSLASAGDAVLLSPASASFDMFRDYQERGNLFKEAVSSTNEPKIEKK